MLEKISEEKIETTRVGNITYNVNLLKEYAEKLPVEEISLESLREAVSEGHAYWEAEDGSHLGPYHLLKDWEVAQKNPLWVNHIESIRRADLNDPIWISSDGTVFDGVHRLTRAFIDGLKVIKARRFQELPERAQQK